MKICIEESHHFVLRHWAQLRQSMDFAPRLFTLDYHTDTSAAFRTYIKKQSQNNILISSQELVDQINYKDLNSIEEAISLLDHDEHITAALQSDIISDALVIANNAYNTDLSVYKKHRIICQDKDYNGGAVSSALDSSNLESDFLNEKLKNFNELLVRAQVKPIFEVPYILDIDLDYFNTKAAVVPENANTFLKIAKGAALITIAIEKSHVQICAKDTDLTAEYLLDSVLKLLSTI